jgi:atypical dual specificity phosphatase
MDAKPNTNAIDSFVSSASYNSEADDSASPSCGSSLFLDQLQSKLKKGLRSTTTAVTSLDGSVVILKNQGSLLLSEDAETNSSLSVHNKQFGFVVDTKPDLSVGVIRPWLFISSQDVPNDIILIKTHMITHILSLLPGFELNPQVKNLIKAHLVLEVYDEVNFNLESPEISQALEFIHRCKSDGGRVLVHCNAGISRAPSTVLLYLIKYEKEINFDVAWSEVKKARPFAKPNDGFVNQIKALLKRI